MPGLIHETRALCPRCSAVVTAQLVERARDVYLDGRCAEHGPFANLYFRDAALYRELVRVRSDVRCCDTFDCARGAPCSARSARTMIYMLNVTNNCNMTCDACLSGSSLGKQHAFAPSAELMRALPDARDFGFTPHLVLFGGEPTLHPELEDLVRMARAKGYVPRLATNGLKLRDERYARRLGEAGLSWVFLHVDSLDDAKNQALRGRPMVAASLAAIEHAQAAGMKVQLGATISRDNAGELAALLHFARRHGIFWVSLYPVAEVERPGASGAFFLSEVIAALEAQTEGQIRRSDFITMARLWALAFKLTGRYNFRQKPTMVSLPTVIAGERFVPINRFASPSGALGEARALAAFVRSLPSLFDYEHRPPSGDTLVINIQQFQGRSAFDLDEAVHSLMSFAHAGSFHPFDVYNHVHRYAEPLVPAGSLRRASA